jgi:hypothetical protein
LAYTCQQPHPGGLGSSISLLESSRAKESAGIYNAGGGRVLGHTHRILLVVWRSDFCGNEMLWIGEVSQSWIRVAPTQGLRIFNDMGYAGCLHIVFSIDRYVARDRQYLMD